MWRVSYYGLEIKPGRIVSETAKFVDYAVDEPRRTHRREARVGQIYSWHDTRPAAINALIEYYEKQAQSAQKQLDVAQAYLETIKNKYK